MPFIIYIDNEDLVNILGKLKDFNEWELLGLELGIKQATLNRIKNDERGNINTCKRLMLVEWLRWADNVDTIEFGRPSWKRLVDALGKVDKKLADKIRTGL